MGITYRSEKGSPLTIEELDNNFRHFTGSQSITGSLTVSGSVITVDASGSLGSIENPWKDLYITNNTLVMSNGTSSINIGLPSTFLTSSFTTRSLSFLDNGGGMTLQYSSSVSYQPSSSMVTGSDLKRIYTDAEYANHSGEFKKYIFSKRDINDYSYSTGSGNLFSVITASARESDSFLVRLYSDADPTLSVYYRNSGSVELTNIDSTTGEGDLLAYLAPIGGTWVGSATTYNGSSGLSYINGSVTNMSFQVSKTAPFTYTNSGSFLISSSISDNEITFNKLDGSSFTLTIPSATTFYKNDSSLTSNRTVDLDGNSLTFDADNGESFTINLDNGATVKIPNLLSASPGDVLGYNTSTGQLSYLSSSEFTNVGAYTYVPSTGDSNSQISGSVQLRLTDADAIYGGSSFPTVASSEITIQQNGVYKIEYNAIISGSTSGTSNSWWSVQLKLDQSGSISYPVSNYAVKSNLEPYYGSVHLLYVGSLGTGDTISFIGNTTDTSIDHLRGRAFVRKIS